MPSKEDKKLTIGVSTLTFVIDKNKNWISMETASKSKLSLCLKNYALNKKCFKITNFVSFCPYMEYVLSISKN